MLQALIFDVDGTLAETERDGHRVAFNQAFESAGLDWHWDADLYGELLAVTGGKERMAHYLRNYAPGTVADPHADTTIRALHLDKNRRYAEMVSAGDIPLRDGIRLLVEQGRTRGLQLAIATTTSRENVDALMQAAFGDDWSALFAAVVAGDEVPAKKPAPDVYMKALELLGRDAAECIALEDSAPGLAAARAAGIPCVVTRGIYSQGVPMEGALACLDGLGNEARSASGDTPEGRWQGSADLDRLSRWHAMAGT